MLTLKLCWRGRIYISDNYSLKTIGKYTLNCNCKDNRIQICNFNSNQIFYLGVIYRHPKSNVINFISALNDKLILLGKQKYFIVGDFKINIDDKNLSVNFNMHRWARKYRGTFTRYF